MDSTSFQTYALMVKKNTNNHAGRNSLHQQKLNANTVNAKWDM